MKKLLSLCLIFRDEEKNLSEFLSFHDSLADEYIFVDTGSQDSSAQIIGNHQLTHSSTQKSAKYQLFDFAWRDDFSLARNYALDRAEGEWIIFLDADERIIAEDGLRIREMLPNIAVDGLFLPIHNVHVAAWPQERICQSTCYNVRLFRNKPAYRYAGAIHEDIVNAIEDNHGRLARLEFAIWHLGYHQQVMAEKTQRNRFLIEKAWQNNPQDPTLCLYYALLEGQSQKALELMESALLSAQSDGMRYQLIKQIFIWYQENQADNTEKIKYWETMLQNMHPDCFLLYLYRGRRYFAQQQVLQALDCYYQTYRQLAEVSEVEYHIEVLDKLSLLCAMSNRLPEALSYNRQLRRRFGTNVNSWHFTLKLLFAHQDYQGFIQELQTMPSALDTLEIEKRQEIIRLVEKLEFMGKAELLQKLASLANIV